MTATRAAGRTPARRIPSRPDPLAAPTRARATASAAGRMPGTAAAGPRRSPAALPGLSGSRAASASSAASASAASATSASATSASAASAASVSAVAARTQARTQPQPRTQPVPRTPLRVVAPPDPDARGRVRRRVAVGALVGLAAAGLFAIVGVRVLLAQGQGPVDALESQVTSAQAETQRLRLDVARLESPSRIVAEAQSRLAMIPPAAVVYLPPLAPTSQPITAQIPTAQIPTAQAPTDQAQAPLSPPAG